MNDFLYKKIGIIICSTLLIFSAHSANAATITFSSSKTNLGINEQFYVDVLLDPEGEAINGIEGAVIYPANTLSFIRAEEGKSIVTAWIQKPIVRDTTIEFSGIIPNGFSGVINPFETSKKSSGLVIRLVFEAKKSGQADIVSSSFTLAANDGQGTLKSVPSAPASVFIRTDSNTVPYQNKTVVNPELSASIMRNQNLFDNKYALIFHATDMETGIKSIRIKEGGREWKEALSPYLLEDQTRHSRIIIEATNFFGGSTVVMIDSLPYVQIPVAITVLIILIVFTILLYIRKIYAHTTKK